MNFNEKEGAQIISAFLFDGGIVHDLRPFYTNNNEFLISRVIKNVSTVVGHTEFNKRTDDENIRVEFPKILGHILVDGLGMIPGSKVIRNTPIPSFILHSKLSIIRVFLQQAFDDEGSVHLGRSGRSVQLSQHNSKTEPPVRLLQLKELVEKFNIPVNGPHGPVKAHKTKKGYISYGWVIQISNLSDIYNFAKKINFGLPNKRNKLRELLDSYVLPSRFKKGTIKNKILGVCEELNEENKDITIKNISFKLNKHESWVAEVMRDLVEEGKLGVSQEKSPNHVFRGGFSEKEFQLLITQRNL